MPGTGSRGGSEGRCTEQNARCHNLYGYLVLVFQSKPNFTPNFVEARRGIGKRSNHYSKYLSKFLDKYPYKIILLPGS